eukprot:6031722-Pyramimonas_sp.AAC.1
MIIFDVSIAPWGISMLVGGRAHRWGYLSWEMARGKRAAWVVARAALELATSTMLTSERA